MPSVSVDTNFYTVSIEKFEEFVNRRRIDNTIKEQIMIYKTLHRKQKIEQRELLKTVGLRCSRKVSISYCIAACEILRLYLLTMYIYCAFPENIRNKRHSNRLPLCQLSRSHLYWYSFFSLLNMNQVPEKLYFGEWSYATKIIQSVQYACLNRSSAG